MARSGRHDVRRTKLDTEPATPTEIKADHGHVASNGLITDAVKYELPVKMEPTKAARSAVVIWSYDNGDCGMALHPWRPKETAR